MLIYYDDINNEVILNKKDMNNETDKDVYPLGHLLVEFVELNFDEIIQLTETELNLNCISNNDKSISHHVAKIIELYDRLKDLHPYFGFYNKQFKEYIDCYELYLMLDHDEKWFKNKCNSKSLFNFDASIIKLSIENLLEGKITFKEFRNVLDDYLHSKFNKMYIFEGLKEFIYDCMNTSKRFKKAIEFCLDSENAEFNNLSTIQRLYLYQLTIDKEIMNNTVRTKFSINTIDDKFKNNDNIEHLIISNNLKNKEILNLLPKQSIELYEEYDLNVRDACYLELIKLILKGTTIKKCNNCNKYFINISRSDTLYCNRPIDDGKTCKDVGAIKTYKNNIKDDPILKEYSKFYKRNNARVRYKKLSKKEFFDWSKEAREMRDKAREGKITYNEFKNWLNNN